MNLDCYVRIADHQLPRMRLIHLQSGVDDDESMDEHKLKGEGALLTCEISGYTEWVGESVPATSPGWDWVIAPPNGELMVRAGSIRTNIMLVDDQGADCGLDATVQACGRLLAQWSWQPDVLAAIGAATHTGVAGVDPETGKAIDLQAAAAEDHRDRGVSHRPGAKDKPASRSGAFQSRDGHGAVMDPRLHSPALAGTRCFALTGGSGFPPLALAEARRMDFEFCSFGMKAPVPLAAPRATWCSNYPLAWQQRYDEMGYIRKDPTVAHAIISDNAVVWSDELFASAPEIRAEAGCHGLVHGWAQPRRDARSMVSLLTLARAEPPISEAEQQAKGERLKWLSFVCHEGMLKVWGQLLQEGMAVELSARELEVLRWSCDGKTAGDTAQILGLSEATVNFHARNACLKLGTSNKTAAAVRAALMGLLW